MYSWTLISCCGGERFVVKIRTFQDNSIILFYNYTHYNKILPIFGLIIERNTYNKYLKIGGITNIYFHNNENTIGRSYSWQGKYNDGARPYHRTVCILPRLMRATLLQCFKNYNVRGRRPGRVYLIVNTASITAKLLNFFAENGQYFNLNIIMTFFVRYLSNSIQFQHWNILRFRFYL